MNSLTIPTALLTAALLLSGIARSQDSAVAAKATAERPVSSVSKAAHFTEPLPPGPDDGATQEIVIALAEGKDIEAFAQRHGLIIIQRMLSDAYSFTGKAPTIDAARAALAAMQGDAGLRWADYNRPSHNQRFAFVPNDPYFNAGNPAGYPGQWHLKYVARPEFDTNLEGAWNRDLTGSTVIIGICDDGFQRAHPDLSPGYVAADSFDFADNDSDPNPVDESDNHGTSVGGVAGGRGGNGIGATGAAPLARLAGLRLPFAQAQLDSQFADATKYHSFGTNRNIRVKNHSYGVGAPFAANGVQRNALADSTLAGTIHIIAAGNDRGEFGEDSNKKALQNSPHAITVAAFASSGIFSDYSCYGSNIFVTASSSSRRNGEFEVTCVDRTGAAGYGGFPDLDYTGTFGGTSSAAPLVAGIIALGVQANPALNTRLAKHLLVRSCDLVDANDTSANSDGGWKTNGAGFRFNPSYGFGLIDADEFTRLAAQATGVSALTEANVALVNVNAAIPDNAGSVTRTFTVSATTPLEEVELMFNITHPFRGHLEATLRSPAGTTSRVFSRSINTTRPNGGQGDNGTNISNWWFTINSFWGENPAGTWTITLSDVANGNAGTWVSYQARMRMGTLNSNNAQPPTVAAIAPASGPPGTRVVLTGDKFTGATQVTFNGTPAVSFTVVSVTRIEAVVASGTTTGVVRVVSPGGAGTGAGNFTVTATPLITGFTPVSGAAGTAVTITGSNFTGATAVRFDNTTAAFTVASATQINTTVPTAATTGRVSVTVGGVSDTSGANFTITNAPGITSFAPAQGGPGTSVVILGSNFTGATAVRFNGTTATFTVNNAGQITATVPAAASSGVVTVVKGADTATSAAPFAIIGAPVITNFTPASAPLGGRVVITGQNFTGATAVTFNNVAAAGFAVDSALQISATVPAGPVNGTIRVTTPSGSAASTASFTLLNSPGNDQFLGALLLTGDAGTQDGDNTAATREGSEPLHAGNTGGRSLWFNWVAPATGTWIFDTGGSRFDTVLAVYTGAVLNGLNPLAANDDHGSGSIGESTGSLVTINVTSGTTYRIAVDGYNSSADPTSASRGALALNWRRVLQAPQITGFTPASGSIGTQVQVNGLNLDGATTVRFNGTTAVFSPVNDTSLTTTVPAGATTGPLTVVSAGGTGTSTTSFTVVTGLVHDTFASGRALTGATGGVDDSNAAATFETGEPAHADSAGGASLWYSWTAPVTGRFVFDTIGSDIDTLLAIYTGTAVNALTPLVSNDDIDNTAGNHASRVSLNAVAGTVYRIAVDGWSGLRGNVALSWSQAAAAVITSFSPGAGAAGTIVTINGTGFTNPTGVLFNAAAATFTVDSATQITATLPAAATTGVISVLTPNGTATSATAFQIQSSDNFSGRQALTGSTVVLANNTGTTKESGEPDHADDTGGHSLWFTWTAPASGTWTVETSGSDFDTTLAVYTGTTLAGLTLIDGNDDAEDATSAVTFQATTGTVYAIAVDGYSGADGNVVLAIYQPRSVLNLYSTGFESFESFTAGFTLAGQGGWLASGSLGNGVGNDILPGEGQSAFIGFNPPENVNSFLWRPVNYVPTPATRPIVRFSATIQIVDSTNDFYDDFEWTLFNSAGDALCALNFDNTDLRIFTATNGNYTNTGRNFENSTTNEIAMILNFATNTWSAEIDGGIIASNLGIGLAGQIKDVADMDATWRIRDTTPGDNYMIFDNYSIVAEGPGQTVILAPPSPVTVAVGAAAGFGVVASGTGPFTFQWQRNGVNLPGATNRIYRIASVQSGDAGNFRVIVTGPSGASVTSAVAALSLTSSGSTQTYTAWTATAFPVGTPAANLLPTADPDRDGLLNLMEYALGLPPVTPNGSAVGLSLLNGRLVAEVIRTAARPDVEYFFEATSDVSNGPWTRLVSSLDSPTLLRATDTVNTQQSALRGLRLRVALIP